MFFLKCRRFRNGVRNPPSTLSTQSDQHLVSPYNTTTEPFIWDHENKEMITI